MAKTDEDVPVTEPLSKPQVVELTFNTETHKQSDTMMFIKNSLLTGSCESLALTKYVPAGRLSLKAPRPNSGLYQSKVYGDTPPNGSIRTAPNPVSQAPVTFNV